MIIIETERLLIRDNIKSDLYDLYELTTNNIDMRYMKSTKIDSLREAKENLKKSIKESKKKCRKKYFFAITDKKQKYYIGAIGYTVEVINEKKEKVVELGYFIKNKYWNKGYVTEAGKAVIDFAFNKDNVIKIEASCLKINKASEKVMIKLGMKKEGELRNHQYHEAEWKDRVLYGLLKEDNIIDMNGLDNNH